MSGNQASLLVSAFVFDLRVILKRLMKDTRILNFVKQLFPNLAVRNFKSEFVRSSVQLFSAYGP